MFFEQIKRHGDNFSYVIADEASKDAAVIDPSYNFDAISRVLRAHGLKVRYVIDTHQHGDHTAGNGEIKSEFGAKVVAHELSGLSKDISVKDGDSLKLGSLTIKVIHTPGHSPDGICLLVDNKLFTGDTLFVGECGRTDVQGGSPQDMYRSLFEKLLKLDDNTEVYPGHDYGKSPCSTIGRERETNYTLEKRSLREFVEFMREP